MDFQPQNALCPLTSIAAKFNINRGDSDLDQGPVFRLGDSLNSEDCDLQQLFAIHSSFWTSASNYVDGHITLTMSH
jgi:hypothetical protein